MEKEYIIVLHADVDHDRFWDDMESITNLDGIPNRKVEVANRRPGSKRSTHYYLTDQERGMVESDRRVRAVEEPVENRDDVIIAPDARQRNHWPRANDPDGDNSVESNGTGSNWGLYRHRSVNQNYPYGSYNANEDYIYTLDGTGVDVVIQDSGMQSGHPEWEDANGNSRLVNTDWAALSGLSFSNAANNNTDTDGHGTHVGGIVAGKTYGWAKNAQIYSQKVSGLQGSGDTAGISSTYLFDSIKEWHKAKPIDPKTGHKRPTIVNASWGFVHEIPAGGSFTLNYRGTTYSSSFKDYGLATYTPSAQFRWGNRISSVDSDVEEMIEEGIIFCKSAGNNNIKIDVPGGDDYDNYVNYSGQRYYHRGSSPFSENGIIVGALDYLPNTTAQTVDGTSYGIWEIDRKASFSDSGPAVDIYAAGRFIMSAMATSTSRAGVANYYANSSYKQHQMSGTSQASPNVAGLAALLMQANPNASPADIKNYIIRSSGDKIYRTSSDTDYTESHSLMGGERRVMFNTYGDNDTPITFDGFGGIPIGVKV